MRNALLWFALTACNSTPDKPSQCYGECRPEDVDCTSFPYESLPARCQSICYDGSCCSLKDNVWHYMSFDCARPVDGDAGVDAPGDGAPDA